MNARDSVSQTNNCVIVDWSTFVKTTESGSQVSNRSAHASDIQQPGETGRIGCSKPGETGSRKIIANGRAVLYAHLLPDLIRVAREHGYALGVHGSMVRDLDLIACPWTEEATSALTLIRAIKEEIGACTHKFDPEMDALFVDCAATAKPHGRVAYSLHLSDRGADGPYIDVSVMPRLS